LVFHSGFGVLVLWFGCGLGLGIAAHEDGMDPHC